MRLLHDEKRKISEQTACRVDAGYLRTITRRDHNKKGRKLGKKVQKNTEERRKANACYCNETVTAEQQLCRRPFPFLFRSLTTSTNSHFFIDCFETQEVRRLERCPKFTREAQNANELGNRASDSKVNLSR